MSLILSILSLFFLIFWSGFFSASETALFSISSSKIKAFQTSFDKRKRLIAKLVLKPKDLLVTIFMLNTLVNILIQNTVSDLFGYRGGWGLKVGVPFFLMLFFGEIIPKYIGLQNNISLAEFFSPTINFLQNILKPIRTWIVKITVPVSQLMFFFLRKEESISKEELKHVLKTSQEHGVLTTEEADLVWGYLDLQDYTIKELMRPREDILYYDILDPLSKLTYLFSDQECSRLPVCNKTLDNILGIINAKDYFLNRHEISTSGEIQKILQKPMYVPENTPAKTFIKRLQEFNQVLALVVDEYGSISGLITQEDIIEVVIGDITDLRDSKDLYIKAGDNEIIASGRLELSEFNKIFESNLFSKSNMLTIGGWLIEHLGDIPKSGSRFEIQKFLFQVLAAEPTKIRRLYIKKITQQKKSNRR